MNPLQRTQPPARSILVWFSRLPVSALLGLAVLWVVFEFVVLGRYSLIFVADDITVIPYLMAFYANDIR